MGQGKQQPKLEINQCIRFRDNCDTEGRRTDGRTDGGRTEDGQISIS